MARIAQLLHLLAFALAILGGVVVIATSNAGAATALSAHLSAAFTPPMALAVLVALACMAVAWAIDARRAPEQLAADARATPLAEDVEAPSTEGLPADERSLLRRRLAAFLETPAEPNVVGFVDELLAAAARAGASDVHIQPLADSTRVAFRVQGVLDEILSAPSVVHPNLTRRLKILAKLVVYQTSLPQDGAFSIETAFGAVEARISTVPTHHGEKIALRLAHVGNVPDLAELGLPAGPRAALEELLGEPQGLIVLTGPTGSGKTTTIYSALNHIHTSRGQLTNMATIEDPIELHLPFLNQTQVDPKRGLDFATGLRALLRQDPNVLMVGEIRDPETAQIAIQAGLTGHLVLTTLHAESTAGVFNRLIDTGLEPFLVASSTLACLSQRLVRRLCPSCREPASVPRSVMSRLERQGVDLEGRTFYASMGCEACGETGLYGRTAIYEMLRVTPALRRKIAGRMTTDELREAALEEGMVPLVEAAVEAAAAGEIRLEEALRVTGG